MYSMFCTIEHLSLFCIVIIIVAANTVATTRTPFAAFRNVYPINIEFAVVHQL